MDPTAPAVQPTFNIVDATVPGMVAFLIGVTVVLLAAVLVAWAVIRAASLPPPTALITSLSLLTLFATAGGIATNNDAAWTIAAAGVGALAGSVTAMFQQPMRRQENGTLVPVQPVSQVVIEDIPRPPDPPDESHGLPPFIPHDPEPDR